MKNAIVIAAVALTSAGARADIVSHAIVRYGDATHTIDEHFGSASASAELLYTSPGLFHGVADGAAAYGTVTATVSLLAIGAAYPTNAAHAEAAFSDLLTINGPSGMGFVIYTYTVTGSSSGDLSQGALFLHHGSDPDEELDDEIAGEEEFASVPHAIVFGQAFTHGVVLLSDSGIGLGESGEFGSELTATMTSLEVFDAAMNPIGQFTVGSASGTQYPLPTPGGTLVLAAAAGLLTRRRRHALSRCC